MKTTRRTLLGGLALGGGALAFGQGAKAQEQITANTLECAENILGVDYSESEIEQMLVGLDDWAAGAAQLRSRGTPNTLQPSSVFDPRLPGQNYDVPQGVVSLPPESAGSLPGSEADIAFAPSWKQAKWLRSGAISSLELTNIYLRRIENYAGRLECFVTVTAELARQQASAADDAFTRGEDLGPLHGIPYALKDIIDVAGVRSTWGATPYQDRIADVDATVYERLTAAGAVHLGKATNGALAYNDLWWGGLTRNPWNTNEGSSGSSAGSASAVAAGLASFAIGTETLGSIISPSNRCGTTGLRPSFGRVSRAGAMALCWSLDKIGPITRDVADTALVLAILNGYDDRDASSIDVPLAQNWMEDPSELRVGYIPSVFENASTADIAALEAVRALGCEMIEVDLPQLPYGALAGIVEVESAAAFEHLTLSGQDDLLRWQENQSWPNTWRRARLRSAIDYINIDRFRREVCEAIHDTFQSCDVIIGPNFAAGMLLITNFTGHPSLILRSGFNQRPLNPLTASGAVQDAESTFRMPTGTSLWAPMFREDRLVSLGRAIEARLDVAGERPEEFA